MSLKLQAIRGVKWTTISMVVVTATQFAQLAVLGRLLVPEDFGIMAIMMVLIGFSQAFMDMGISNAIIQKQEISHRQLSSLYWLNLFSGLILTLLIAALAPWLADFYNDSRLKGPMLVLSTIFFVVAIGNQYRVLCQKQLQFERMAIIEMVAAVSAMVIAIVLALLNFGIYALALAMLAQALVSSMLFLFVGLRDHHRPSLIYAHSEIRDFIGFGLYQMGEKSINYLNAYMDQILIGKVLGMQAVGYYNMAWQLIMFPVIKISPIVNKVAFPVYAKFQGAPEKMQLYYTLSVQALIMIIVPLLVFLALWAEEIVFIVFGAGWHQTAVLVSILAFVGMLKVMGNPAGALVLAKGRPELGFWWNCWWLLVVTIGVGSTLLWLKSLEAVVWALLALSLTFGLGWHFVVARVGRINYRPIAISFLKTIVVSLAIGLIFKSAISLADMHRPWLVVFVALITFTPIYMIYVYLFERRLLMQLKSESN